MDSEKDPAAAGQYKDLIRNLNQLQEVKAPKYFEADLMRRIKSEDFEKDEVRVSFWNRFFSPAKLIPTAALAAVMVVMLFITNNQPNISDDPLLAAPRERTDLISSNDIAVENFIKEKQENSISLKKDKSARDEFSREDSDLKDSQSLANKSFKSEGLSSSSRSLKGGNLQGKLNAPAVQASFAISKSGLNFRQVNLSKEERKEVEHLREKLLNSYQKQ